MTSGQAFRRRIGVFLFFEFFETITFAILLTQGKVAETIITLVIFVLALGCGIWFIDQDYYDDLHSS